MHTISSKNVTVNSAFKQNFNYIKNNDNPVLLTTKMLARHFSF